jgi:hypothetical protein
MADRRRGRPRLLRFVVVGVVVVAALVAGSARAPLAARLGAGGPSPALGSSPAAASVTTTARPGRVFVAGDSLTFTATWDHGPGHGAPADLEWAAWLGWTAADAQSPLDAAVAAQGPVDTLVVALGTNDSSVADGGDGWTDADLDRFRQLIATAGSGACVVVVLPGHGAGLDPRHAAEMDQARADLAGLADQRRHTAGNGPTVVVDWQATVDAHPELIAADGIHLTPDAGTGEVSADAATARTTVYWRGVDACTG